MNHPSATDLARAVRAEIARAQLSQRDVAEVIGISQAGVSRRLTGETALRAEELSKIARALGVPVSVFYEQPKRASA